MWSIWPLVGKIEQMAAPLSDKIVHAASQGSLSPDILLVLEERWVRLDEILDYREQRGGGARTLESW